MMDKLSSDFLGPVDTAFLHVESNNAPMNIGAVALFAGQIAFEALLHHVDVRIHEVPKYQKRLVIPPLNLGQPRWMLDPNFDIRNHVFRARLPAPGGEEQLRLTASRLVSSTLDRSKPLWEIHLLEGLKGDQSALFFKVHHAMVDGLAAIELFTMLLDLTPETRPEPDLPRPNPMALPTDLELLVSSVTEDLSYKWDVLNKLGRNISFLGSVVADRDKRRQMFFGVANLVSDTLSPIKPLAINGQNSGTQQLAWVDLPLSEVKAIRKAAEVSVNDVMLSILSAAVDRYETHYHGVAGRAKRSFRVLVPVNMREEDNRHDLCNRISVLPVDIPLGIDDPLKRLRKVGEITRIMKQSYLANGLDMLLTLPALTPAASQPIIWSFAPPVFAAVAHTWCTNVAGPDIPVYLMGHQMVHSYGFFPLNPSMGLASVIMSYNQRITMTLVVDTGIIPDIQRLKAELETAYEALRTAAGVQPTPSIKPAAPQVTVVEKAPPNDPLTPEEQIEQAAAATMLPMPSTNGHTTEEAALEAVPKVVVESVNVMETPAVEAGFKLFSQPWADAFHAAINGNPNYRRTSTHWRAGALAFVLKAAPGHGYPTATAVLMDLFEGDCRSAVSVTPYEANQRAVFVIEGEYRSWMRVLNGELAPLAALMRGDLKLAKGALLKLLPYTQSAEQLVLSAQRVPVEV